MSWSEIAILTMAACALLTMLATLPFNLIRSCQSYKATREALKLVKEIRTHQLEDKK